jgi:hypothetical protein
MLHLLSTIVVAIIAVGFWLRKRKNPVHVRLMFVAFLVDLFLVLYIEMSRNAVQKVVTSTRPLVWFHAAVSVLVLICYVVMIQLGRSLLAGKSPARKWHRTLGMTFLVLRGVNYVTSFMVT